LHREKIIIGKKMKKYVSKFKEAKLKEISGDAIYKVVSQFLSKDFRFQQAYDLGSYFADQIKDTLVNKYEMENFLMI
jgi:hypothetical protein